MAQEKYTCPLCQSQSIPFHSEHFRKCSGCQSVFRSKKYFITREKEQARYEKHNNDITDKKYQDFMSPIVDMVIKNQQLCEKWLDFWAGTGPVVTYMLEQKWFHLKLYDPFFHNYPALLKQKYDFIIATEVVEHFYNPLKEFELLYNLLNQGWKLYIMTNLYSPEIDFWKWYYKNDITHVFFYSEDAFKYIKNHWGWENYLRHNRCIILEKK